MKNHSRHKSEEKKYTKTEHPQKVDCETCEMPMCLMLEIMHVPNCVSFEIIHSSQEE